MFMRSVGPQRSFEGEGRPEASLSIELPCFLGGRESLQHNVNKTGIKVYC